VFSDTYSFFDIELVCFSIETSSMFKVEKDSYTYLKRLSTTNGYKYYRIDTAGQIGFPDILLLKEREYCLIEVKRLENKNLVSLEDNLKWQYGQIAFALRSFKLNLDYLLAVCKENKLAFIGKENTVCHLKKSLRI